VSGSRKLYCYVDESGQDTPGILTIADTVTFNVLGSFEETDKQICNHLSFIKNRRFLFSELVRRLVFTGQVELSQLQGGSIAFGTSTLCANIGETTLLRKLV
jgi:hypothetical protein